MNLWLIHLLIVLSLHLLVIGTGISLKSLSSEEKELWLWFNKSSTSIFLTSLWTLCSSYCFLWQPYFMLFPLHCRALQHNLGSASCSAKLGLTDSICACIRITMFSSKSGGSVRISGWKVCLIFWCWPVSSSVLWARLFFADSAAHTSSGIFCQGNVYNHHSLLYHSRATEKIFLILIYVGSSN